MRLAIQDAARSTGGIDAPATPFGCPLRGGRRRVWLLALLLAAPALPVTAAPRGADAAPPPGAAMRPEAGRPAPAPGTPRRRTLADLLRERDGAGPRPASRREFERDGSEVLPARMGAF